MRQWLPVLVLAALVLATTLFWSDHEVSRPSVNSRAGQGYHAALAYLQARGRDAGAWEAPLAELPGPGTLVLALPGVRPVTDAEIPALARWVRGGGHFVLLPSPTVPTPGPLLDFLRVAESTAEDATGPVEWDAWREWAQIRTRLVGDGLEVHLATRGRMVGCPVGARVTLRTADDDRAAVCTLAVGSGTITVVNSASAWSNDQLPEADNLALLERLTAHEGPVWFDEWHQGAHPTEAESDLGFAPAALLAHAALLYVGFAWALSRPVGPPLPPLGGPSSSMLRELDVLGQLHAAGGHAAAAAERLHALATHRFRRLRLDAPIPPAGPGEAGFVDLARRVGILEKEGRDGHSR